MMAFTETTASPVRDFLDWWFNLVNEGTSSDNLHSV